MIAELVAYNASMRQETGIPGRSLPVFAILTILAIIPDMGCDQKPAAPAASSRPNVLLVTFDTTRADYLSCYGRPGNTTPAIDAVAREGIRFANCYTPAPITLPAHASIMTGLYPFQHKLRDNGAGVLDEKAVTLAELFKAAGYRTGAFVGAYVLHSRYGLNQGFEVYSDEFQGIGARMEDGAEFAERRAQAVSDAALAWVDQKDDRPFFLWVHYFDAHAPYEPPGRAAGGDPRDAYAAEISYADGELSRVLRKVEELSHHAKRQSWYIMTADHGEGLGDHGEETHGFFTYNTTLHVPLVIKGAGIQKIGVSKAPVSLIDIYPSLARWLQFPLPYEIAGTELPLAPESGGDVRPLYFETMVPFHLYGWSPLEGVVVSQEKLVRAPTTEFYDLAADPGETRNLASVRKERTMELAAMLGDVQRNSPGIPVFSAGKQEIDEASLQKLRSLGYVSGSQDSPAESSSLPDPKEMMALVGKLKDAEKLLGGGDLNGIPILAEVLALDPNNVRALSALENFVGRPLLRKSIIPVVQARMHKPLPPPFDVKIPAALGLAMCREGQTVEGMELVSKAERIDANSIKVLAARSGCLEQALRFDEATAIWEKVLRGDPRNAAALDALGDLFVHKQDFGRAADTYAKAVSIDGKNAETQANLANALLHLNRIPEATDAFRRALQLAPHLTSMRTKLGSLLLQQGKAAEAVEEYRLVVAARPDLPGAHYDLGVALTQSNQPAGAVSEFRESLRLAPEHADAQVNLGVTLLQQGQSAEGREVLLRATKMEVVAGAAHFNLAIAAQREADSIAAVRHLEQAAASRPPSIPAIEELAARYLREGKYSEAGRVLREGVAAAPDDLKLLNSQASLLATCPDDSIRDGAESLRLAKLADEKTNHAHPAILSTLASAQAETGDFAAAIETTTRASGLVSDQQAPLKAILARQLESFKAGRPHRLQINNKGE